MPLFNERHSLTMGGQWREQKFKDTLVSAPLNLSQYQWALFAENEWRIVDDLALTLGARYDRNEQFGGKWSPRGYGLERHAGVDFQGRREQGLQDAGHQPDDRRHHRPGRAGHPAAAGQFATASRNQHLVGAGRGLRRRRRPDRQPDGVPHPLQDKLDNQNVANCRASGPVPGCLDLGVGAQRRAGGQFPQRVNVDSATIKGFELGGRVPLFEGWSFNANYTLTASEVTSGAKQGQPLGSQPRHALNLGLKWQVNDKFSTWVRGEYRAKQFNDMNWEKEQVFYSPYWLASLGGSYAVSKNVTLSASVYNLFDKNFENYGPTKTGASAPTAATNWSNSYRQVLEGRRLWVSANITF